MQSCIFCLAKDPICQSRVCLYSVKVFEFDKMSDFKILDTSNDNVCTSYVSMTLFDYL